MDHNPIHVVAAKTDNNETIVITVYEASHDMWKSTFRKRKR